MKNAYNTSAYGSFAYVYDIFMDMVPDRQFIQGTAGDSSISNSSPEVVESGLSEECS